MASQVATLLNWLESLPADLLSRRPRLSIICAWATLVTGQYITAEQHLAAAERAAAGAEGPLQASLQAQIAVARAIVTIYTGEDPIQAIAHARLKLKEVPQADTFLRGSYAWVAGIASFIEGDATAARRAFDESIEISQAAGNTLIGQMGIYIVGYQEMLQGHLRLAAETLERGLRLARAGKGPLPPIMAVVYQALAELLRQRSELDVAEDYLAQAAALGEQLRSPEMLIDSSMTAMLVRQARGDRAGARRALDRANAYVRESRVSPLTVRQVTAWHARLEVAQGDLLAAERWAGELKAARAATPAPAGLFAIILDGLEDLVLARLSIARLRYAEAGQTLQALLEKLDAPECTVMRLETLALLALAQNGLDEHDQALATLRASLLIAEPEGFARVFLDEGPAMAALLARLIGRSDAASGESGPALLAYARQLLAQFGPIQGTPPLSMAPAENEPAGHPESPLVEPLSRREREVLALLGASLSNREIAARLVITVGTVKRHVNSIYGKLAVSTRAEAIRRARSLGHLA